MNQLTRLYDVLVPVVLVVAIGGELWLVANFVWRGIQ